jgi:hypothetical protein
METFLWGLDLIAVVFLCHWALRQDGAQGKQQGKKKTGQN